MEDVAFLVGLFFLGGIASTLLSSLSVSQTNLDNDAAGNAGRGVPRVPSGHRVYEREAREAFGHEGT